MRPVETLVIVIMTCAMPFLASGAIASQDRLIEKPLDLSIGDLARVTLVYDPNLSRPHAVTPKEQKELDDIEAQGVSIEYEMDTKINRSGKFFVVSCDSGGGASFGCNFKQIGGTSVSSGTHLMGMRFEIPGDGCVYASSEHNDTMFNLRRKFCLDGDSLKEVEQPFDYVGLESATRHALTVYSDITVKHAIGTIAAGSFVEVIVANGARGINEMDEYFLVRDNKGLTGWTHLKPTQEDTDIVGMYWLGD